LTSERRAARSNRAGVGGDFGSKVNIWPPTLATNITPPVAMLKMATPSS
jgi:hypothetical protein